MKNSALDAILKIAVCQRFIILKKWDARPVKPVTQAQNKGKSSSKSRSRFWQEQTVEQSCGQSGCHAELIQLVKNLLMNTLDVMLSTTRSVFGEKHKKQTQPDLNQRLSEKGADSYLWKLCVS